MNVLILGTRAPASLHLARLLSDAGNTVHTADSTAARLCLFSNAVTASHRLPCPLHSRENYLTELEGLCRQHRIELLIPTCEEIFLVSANRDRLPAHTRLLAEPIEVLESLHHKQRFQREVAAAGMVPLDTCSGSDFLNGSPDMGSWIAKPAYSRFGSRVERFDDRKSVGAFLEDKDLAQWVIQRELKGPSYCTYSIFSEGLTLAHVCYRPMSALEHGASTMFESVQHEGVHKWVEKFAHRHQLSGQICFDFIEDERRGLFAIECNPRATSGVHFFNKDLAKAFTHGKKTEAPEEGQQYGLLKAAFLSHGLGALRVKDVIWSLRDPLPFLTQALPLAVHVCQSVSHRCKLTEATVRDIEWNGEPLR